MSRSGVSILTQKFEITDVRDVVVTEAVDDGTGGFARAVRFFGEPSLAGGATLIMEVVIRSADKADLGITAPEMEF